MTIQEFFNKWTGEYCEVAGSSAKNQCVDLVNAYIRDVLGLPIIEWTNAVDFPSKVGDKYDYILNTPTNIPEKGDIVVWSGKIGHIAIFIEGNANRFKSFDQNYPTGSPCHAQEHTYANILGWLRRKPISTPPENGNQPAITDQTKIPQIDNMEVQQIRSVINDLRRDNDSYQTANKEQANLLNAKNSELGKLKEDLDQAQINLNRCQVSLSDATNAEGLTRYSIRDLLTAAIQKLFPK